MRSTGQIAPELLVADDLTSSMQVRVPVVDIIRGHVIARDGLFLTKTFNGSVLGYAARSWAWFDKKEFAQVLQRATDIRAMIVPDRHGRFGYADGFLIQLTPDDAYQYGVDLTEVHLKDSVFRGSIAISATAYLYVLTGLYPNMIGGQHSSSTEIRAIEIKEGVSALRDGSTITTPAMAAKRGLPARPAMVFPAFPTGDVL